VKAPLAGSAEILTAVPRKPLVYTLCAKAVVESRSKTCWKPWSKQVSATLHSDNIPPPYPAARHNASNSSANSPKACPTFKERQHNLGRGNLYILEEPTIGLHLSDVERLIELLHRLVDKGHTVVVIEHHLDVIADADYVIEIGPDGREAGGQLLYQGDVAGLKAAKGSVTAKFL
jgi:hypothetical protein